LPPNLDHTNLRNRLLIGFSEHGTDFDKSFMFLIRLKANSARASRLRCAFPPATNL
jgi:hypothetical protein